MTALSKLTGMMVVIILLGYVAYFAVVNDRQVSVTYWPETASLIMPLWLVALLSFCLGLVSLGLLASVRLSALRLRLYRLQRQTDKQAALIRDKEDSSGETIQTKQKVLTDA
ncbi:MAG: lipopolysaccharide assembly protein LapA domain-containing protein [Candidatus Puniceispirillaceae bacterium]